MIISNYIKNIILLINHKILYKLKLNFGEDLIASILTPLTITTDGIVMIGEAILNPFYD